MIDDEKLMAYVDGELDAEARAEVEAAMAADPELRKRVEAHRRLRTLLSGAYAGTTDEPVPERLSAMLKPKAEVVDLGAARKAEAARPARLIRRNWVAIAATFAVGVIAGQIVNLGPEPAVMSHGGALVAQGALADRLDTQLASAGTGIGLSFRDRDGDYCRTFRTSELAGLACRDGRNWSVRLAVTMPSANSSYRMAGSDLPLAVLGEVEATIAGEPFDAAEEAAARDRGWRD